MKSKTVLVTGAARGIGRAIALAFADAGYDVIINCIKNKSALLELQEEIIKKGHQCLAFIGDISDPVFVESMFQEVAQKFGTIDVLINNAGISYVGLLTDMSLEEWHSVINTNLSSAFYCCKQVIPAMVHQKAGHIINISSMWGTSGASCEVAYSASKGGIDAFTKALAKELAPSHISVNAIACGVIDTDMNRCFSEEDRALLAEEIPAGRFGTPEEVAALAVSIAFSSSYLTGQIIRLDGGFL